MAVSKSVVLQLAEKKVGVIYLLSNTLLYSSIGNLLVKDWLLAKIAISIASYPLKIFGLLTSLDLVPTFIVNMLHLGLSK